MMRSFSFCISVSVASWGTFTERDHVSNWSGCCVCGFECCIMKEEVWVDSGPTSHYETVTEDYMWSRHIEDYSWRNSQPGGLDKSHCKICLPWRGALFLFSYECQVDPPRWSSWYAFYASHMGLALWRSGYLSMPVTEVMVNAIIKGPPFTWAPHITLFWQN